MLPSTVIGSVMLLGSLAALCDYKLQNSTGAGCQEEYCIDAFKSERLNLNASNARAMSTSRGAVRRAGACLLHTSS